MPRQGGTTLSASRPKQSNHLSRKRPSETRGAAQTPPAVTGLGTLQMPLIVLVEFDFSCRGDFNPLLDSFVCLMLGHANTPNLFYAQRSNNRPG